MLLSGWAIAAGLRIALVLSPDATSLVKDATKRLGADLRAAGFDAVQVNAATAADARSAIEEAGDGAFATLYLRSVEENTVDVWIADSMTLKTSVRRIDVAPRKKAAASRAVAAHAVDLLRASLLEGGRPSRSAYDHEAHAHR
jgi:hypothetical protein